MARQEGFEPPAPSLGGRCSILLSYWRIKSIFPFRFFVPRSRKGGYRFYSTRFPPACQSQIYDSHPGLFSRSAL